MLRKACFQAFSIPITSFQSFFHSDKFTFVNQRKDLRFSDTHQGLFQENRSSHFRPSGSFQGHHIIFGPKYVA
jgi:hypothetical protein